MGVYTNEFTLVLLLAADDDLTSDTNPEESEEVGSCTASLVMGSTHSAAINNSSPTQTLTFRAWPGLAWTSANCLCIIR